MALKPNGDFGGSPHPTRYELIDKDGRVHGPFHGLAEANAYVRSRFPNEEQDEDRTGAPAGTFRPWGAIPNELFRLSRDISRPAAVIVTAEKRRRRYGKDTKTRAACEQR